MVGKRNLLCLFFLFPCLSLGKTQPKFYPGQEEKLELPGYKYPSVIYVPYDYKKGRRLPLILFMHGAGGKPTSWPWRSATRGKGYVIVGLSYAPLPGGGAKGIRSDPLSIELMIEYIKKVIDFVDKNLGINRRHIILSGLSMGGWGVNFYGFNKKAKGLYKAYAILAAGVPTGQRVDLSVTKDIPVLLLNGEKDPNLPAAKRGKPLLEKAGAIVTQVVIPGQGHVPGTDTMVEPLSKWLESVKEGIPGRRFFQAVMWMDCMLAGKPAHGRDKNAALLDYIRSQEFMKEAEKGKPVLLYFSSSGTTGKGKETRNARDSRKVLEKTFSFPDAVMTPYAAREFTCYHVDMTGVSRKMNPLLNEKSTPMAILLDSARKELLVMKKEKLNDKSLYVSMLGFLTENKKKEIERRIEKARPLLKELKKLIKEKGLEIKKRAKLTKKARSGKLLEKLRKRIDEKTARIKEILKALRENP